MINFDGMFLIIAWTLAVLSGFILILCGYLIYIGWSLFLAIPLLISLIPLVVGLHMLLQILVFPNLRKKV